MRKYSFYIILALSGLILYSCQKDFIVKDIKNDLVNIIAPQDHDTTANNSIIFWWDELDGAESYNLQIVQPDFNSVQQLLVDTNLTVNKFTHVFTPGTYQWRIKATNGGGSTAYITRTLVIDTTSNLNFVSVGLTTPLNKSVSGNNSITFSWNPVQAADYYELKITNTTSTSYTTIPNIQTTSYTYSLATVTGTEEIYSWQVRAFNSFSQTQNNTSYTFRIDHKTPFVPSLLSPNSYSTGPIGDTTYLKWSRSSSSPDIVSDNIAISNDSLFASVLSSTVITTGSPIRINSFYQYSGSPQAVWWRVSSIDSVGNQSSSSLSKRFYLK